MVCANLVQMKIKLMLLSSLNPRTSVCSWRLPTQELWVVVITETTGYAGELTSA